MGLIDGLRNFFTRGDWYNIFRRLDGSTAFGKYKSDRDKFDMVFSNPAVLKVFSLQCDLFSLGKWYVYKNGKEQNNHPALKRLNSPNPLQSRSQFLWDYMFWNMIGTAYVYVDKNDPENDYNKLYVLSNHKLEFPDSLTKVKDRLIFTKATENDILNTYVKYRYDDGQTVDLLLKKILILTDLSNGLGNWFKGNSRLDALYKVVSNSESALDAKNINIRYSGKFMVAGKSNPDDVNSLPMGEDEKRDIKEKVLSDEPVTPVKSMIDIKRFVENMANLKLDEAYLADYFLIGNMYNIPRDVLEAYLSSTYENQEKARASHVSYTLQPKGEDFASGLSSKWGYTETGEEIVLDWSHLPFAQVFEKDKSEVDKNKSITFANLLNAGVSLEEINQFLDTGFKTGERNYVNSSGTLAVGQGEQGSSESQPKD